MVARVFKQPNKDWYEHLGPPRYGLVVFDFDTKEYNYPEYGTGYNDHSTRLPRYESIEATEEAYEYLNQVEVLYHTEVGE